jgi:hypothetical protein
VFAVCVCCFGSVVDASIQVSYCTVLPSTLVTDHQHKCRETMLRILAQRSIRSVPAGKVSARSLGTAAPSGVVLDGAVPQTADFKANKANMDALVANLKTTISKV